MQVAGRVPSFTKIVFKREIVLLTYFGRAPLQLLPIIDRRLRQIRFDLKGAGVQERILRALDRELVQEGARFDRPFLFNKKARLKSRSRRLPSGKPFNEIDILSGEIKIAITCST
jgi:hypothetical protein